MRLMHLLILGMFLCVPQLQAQYTRIDSIEFRPDLGSISLSGWTKLNEIASVLAQCQCNYTMQIKGVSLINDEPIRARRLALRRSENVKSYLEAIGIAQHQMQTLNYREIASEPRLNSSNWVIVFTSFEPMITMNEHQE
jgi:hypothetical protein